MKGQSHFGSLKRIYFFLKEVVAQLLATQACIAGGIAEAYYHEIPNHIKEFCDNKLSMTTIKTIVKQFEEEYG